MKKLYQEFCECNGKKANPLETPHAVFWRKMCLKYLPLGYCNPRIIKNHLGDYIDHRYRQCCRFQAGQDIVFNDKNYGKARGVIRKINSCWSFFELDVEITQGKYNRQILKIGNSITEIKLAQQAPFTPNLFDNKPIRK